MSTNGEPHEHEWHLFREERGHSYSPEDLDLEKKGADLVWSGDVADLPYREVTVRVFYCSICRAVTVDREYGDTIVPLPRPPRMRKPGMFERWWPKSLRPW